MRDGSGIYTYPPGTPGVAGQTIFSARYNTFLDDLATTLNSKLPINMGGTNATDAAGARANLQVERAMATVTNYDTQVWENGSFWSADGATSAPAAGVFAGIAYVTNNDPNYITVEARANNGVCYVRQKNAGVWGAWKIDGDDRFVNVTGDTMSGSLSVANSHLGFPFCVRTDGDTSVGFYPVSVGSVGFGALNDAQNAWKPIVTYSPWQFIGTITVGAAGTSGVVYFGNTATKYLQYDGTNFILNGGQLVVGGNVVSTGSFTAGYASAAGTIYFGNSGTAYLTWTGSVFNLNGGLNIAGFINPVNCYIGRAGTGGAASNAFNINWNGTPQLWIDATYVGQLAFVSDYRAKKDVADLPSTWDAVKALRPIKYTYNDWTPAWELEAQQKRAAEEGKEPTPFIVADGLERWGFIAHELQDTLIPTAATGHKDAERLIQSPDPLMLIATLTKALQEAMARIEALEAKVPA